jgi:hypothetical protein
MFAEQDETVARSPAEQPVPDETSDAVEQLKRLAELREQGILTEDEFIAEKRNILHS